MTILCFADTRFPIERANGVQTMATCHALAARGHRVTLVTRPDTVVPPRDPFEYYGLPPAPTLAIETVAGPRDPRARRIRFLLDGARRVLRARPDVVFTRDLGVSAFFLKLPSRRRPPLVYESHGLAVTVSAEMPALLGKPESAPSPAKLQRLERRERRVWQDAGAYVTITRALADELASRYGARERIFVVPDGASPAPGARFVTPGAQPVAAYAGHLYPWKGVDVFLEALGRVPEMRGLIVGGHPGEADVTRVRELIQRLGIEHRVELTGLVKPTDVRNRLAPATILVLPNTRSAISERYTSPLKLFEYLTMGRPIVASDLASIREVLTDGETALLVPPGESSALASALARLAADPALAARLAHGAAALAANYTWDRRAERLDAAFAAAAGA